MKQRHILARQTVISTRVIHLSMKFSGKISDTHSQLLPGFSMARTKQGAAPMSRSHTAPPRLGPKSGPPRSPDLGGADACNHASSASTPAADSVQIGEYNAGVPREVRSCCFSKKCNRTAFCVMEHDKVLDFCRTFREIAVGQSFPQELEYVGRTRIIARILVR